MKGKPWTPEEMEIVRNNYPNMVTSEMMQLLPDRSKIAITCRAYKLGLSKSKEFLTKMGESLKISGVKSRFSKGHVPANKGIEMDAELKSKMEHTFFKKGNKPHNTKLAGSISIRKDVGGFPYKFVKIADSDWRLLHRVTWEEHNGPIPEGHRIHFIDKDTLNCDIENLKCLSAQEAMDLNRISDLPVELQQVIKLNNKLTSKLKSYGKE